VVKLLSLAISSNTINRDKNKLCVELDNNYVHGKQHNPSIEFQAERVSLHIICSLARFHLIFKSISIPRINFCRKSLHALILRNFCVHGYGYLIFLKLRSIKLLNAPPCSLALCCLTICMCMIVMHVVKKHLCCRELIIQVAALLSLLL